MISGNFFLNPSVKFKDKNTNKYKSLNVFGLQCFGNILF